jgi:hypothetical protein
VPAPYLRKPAATPTVRIKPFRLNEGLAVQQSILKASRCTTESLVSTFKRMCAGAPSSHSFQMRELKGNYAIG